MGRPLDSRAFGNFTLTSAWIPGDSGASTNATIVKQIGANSYIANSMLTPGLTGTVQLQQAAVTAAGQAQVVVTPQSAEPVGSGATVQPHLRVKTTGVGASGGSGYAASDTVTLTGGVVITVNTVSGGGAILTFTVTNQSDFTSIPGSVSRTATSGSGTGGTFSYTSFELNTLQVTAGGSGYADGATLVLSGNGTGTLTVAGGVVTAAAPVNRGTYTTFPTAQVVGNTAGGSTETARTIWYHQVNTWEGHQYLWNFDGSVPDAFHAAV
jgi:hypothetical protein